jgi:hypothetical protein
VESGGCGGEGDLDEGGQTENEGKLKMKSCKDCKWWFLGICKRHPPISLGKELETYPNDWCGDFTEQGPIQFRIEKK